jgi:hypothetical protein
MTTVYGEEGDVPLAHLYNLDYNFAATCSYLLLQT